MSDTLNLSVTLALRATLPAHRDQTEALADIVHLLKRLGYTDIRTAPEHQPPALAERAERAERADSPPDIC